MKKFQIEKVSFKLSSFNHNAPSCCKNKLKWAGMLFRKYMKKFQIEEIKTKNQNHQAQSVSQVLFYQLSEKRVILPKDYGGPRNH